MRRYEVEFSLKALASLRDITHYFVDEAAHVVTILDVVHTARESERDRFEAQ